MTISLRTLTLSLPSIACNPIIVIMLHLSNPPFPPHASLPPQSAR